MIFKRFLLPALLAPAIIIAGVFLVRSSMVSLSAAELSRLQTLAGPARDGAAERTLRAAANSGSIDAQIALGQVLIEQSAPAKIAEGVQWLERVAATGHSGAQAVLGKFHFRSAQANPDAYSLAFPMLQAAARAGDAGSSHHLGLMYKNGLGIPRDSTAAAHWFKLAANRQIPASMFILANMYLAGDGVPHDEQEARRWIERAAELEHPEANQLMAIGLREGSMGFAKDDKLAAIQMQEAAHSLRHRPQDP